MSEKDTLILLQFSSSCDETAASVVKNGSPSLTDSLSQSPDWEMVEEVR